MGYIPSSPPLKPKKQKEGSFGKVIKTEVKSFKLPEYKEDERLTWLSAITWFNIFR